MRQRVAFQGTGAGAGVVHVSPDRARVGGRGAETLGEVDGTPAADGDDQVDPGSPRPDRGLVHVDARRVGVHAGEDGDREAGGTQQRLCTAGEAEVRKIARGDEEGAGPERLRVRAQVGESALSEHEPARAS